MRTLLPLILILSAAPAAAQIPLQMTFTAEDSKSIAAGSGMNWNDNVMRSEWTNAGPGRIDGLVRFDISALPLGATIQTAYLETYVTTNLASPSGPSAVEVYRVANDTWSRGASDPHPGLNELCTWAPETFFPAQNHFPIGFSLDPNAFNWDVDIADGKLSLALADSNFSSASLVHFFGSDPYVPGLAEPPLLTVNFFPPPEITLTGTCPGLMVLDGTGMTPNGTVLLGYGFVGGSWFVPGGPCAGAMVQFGDPPTPIPGNPSVTADGSGNFSLGLNVPPVACGLVVLIAFDVSSCYSSNPVWVF